MITPLELCDGMVGIHVDTVVFAISTLGGTLGWLRSRRALTSRVAVAIGVTVFATVTIAELGLGPGLLGSVGAARLLVARGALWLGGAGAAVLLARDVVRRKRVRARLRQHVGFARQAEAERRAAEDANQAKSAFVVALSHEMRTPINALLAAAHAVLRMPLEPMQRLQITRIMNEVTRLGRTLNEVLDLRRIEEGQVTLQQMPLAPGEIARDTLDLFSARADEKQLAMTFEADLPPGLLVTGDPRRFRQVLANLIDNAIKFTTRGSVTTRVSYTPPATRAIVGLLTVSVRDTGIGITAEQRASLLAGAASRPTTAGLAPSALGLGIGQRLVRLMGGEITVRSVAGQGSEFAFTIPVDVLNVPDLTTTATGTTAREGRRRVLIVDDVAANRLMLQMFLEQQGFAADYASGGEEAVQLAARSRYDAILMDLQMPNVDGYMATRRIRAAESAENRAVIVAVTAAGDSVTRDQCLAAGMDDHFAKPLELQKFCGALTDLLATRRSPRLALADTLRHRL